MARKQAPAQSLDRVRLVARIDPARVPKGFVMPTRRIRAGVVITLTPQVVEVEPWQAEALRADPMLEVAEVEE